MNLAEFQSILQANPEAALHVMLPSGEFVPAHFHVTEVGRIQKDFIDCGGTTRSSTTCLLQLWVATDEDHRLTSTKLATILSMAAPLLQSTDLPVEVEYEGEVVSQYPLSEVELTPSGILLTVGSKHTDCLAKDRCGIPTVEADGTCSPGSGCC
ncbi:MAG: DUF6428 family protein [Zavarzinella sp.]